MEILTSFPPRVWLRSSHASSASWLQIYTSGAWHPLTSANGPNNVLHSKWMSEDNAFWRWSTKTSLCRHWRSQLVGMNKKSSLLETYPRVLHFISMRATWSAWTASSSGTVSPLCRKARMQRDSSVLGSESSTVRRASPIDSLATPYSVTNRRATDNQQTVTGWLRCTVVERSSLTAANFPCSTLDLQLTGDHLCGWAVRYSQPTRPINSAFHPFGVDKLSSELLYRMCAGCAIWWMFTRLLSRCGQVVLTPSWLVNGRWRSVAGKATVGLASRYSGLT